MSSAKLAAVQGGDPTNFARVQKARKREDGIWF